MRSFGKRLTPAVVDPRVLTTALERAGDGVPDAREQMDEEEDPRMELEQTRNDGRRQVHLPLTATDARHDTSHSGDWFTQGDGFIQGDWFIEW